MRYRSTRRKKIQRKPDTHKKISYQYIFLFVVFIAFSVFITMEGVSSGNELKELEDDARSLSKENRELSEKLVESSSLQDKVRQAKKLGFDKPTDIVYLDGEVSVASLR
ncbi:hypothetical protein JXA63_04910 [Candidatus Woesebacteria bacterium]|nr:hypothetical protein [Candidatus Woesebacteria bacterium]